MRKCSVRGCRSNYNGETEKVTILSLPKDETLRQIWLEKIPTDFTGLKDPAVCIKHFREEDIIRFDRCVVKGEVKYYPRIIPKLIDGAYPQIFPIPYLSKLSRKVPKTLQEDPELDSALQQYVQKLKIKNMRDIINYFNQLNEEVKKHWCIMSNEEKVVLCLINIAGEFPKIVCSIVVKNSLRFQVYCGKRKIYKNIPDQIKKIVFTSNLDKLMDFCCKYLHKT